MSDRMIVATLYTVAAKHRTKQAIIRATKKAVDSKSELTCIAATSVVVGVAARTVGFKAGYEYATNATTPAV